MRVCEVASRRRENSSRTTKHDVQADSQLAKSGGAKLSTAGPNVLAPADVPAHELEPVYRPMRRSLIARCPVPGHIPDEDVAGEDHVSLFRRVFQPRHEIELTGSKCATVKLAGTHGERPDRSRVHSTKTWRVRIAYLFFSVPSSPDTNSSSPAQNQPR